MYALPIVVATTVGVVFLGSLVSGMRLYSTALARAETVTNASTGAQNQNDGPAAEQVSRSGTARVELYGATWCPACRAAKQWLDQHHIAYTEYDVDRDRDANARMRRLSPRGSIPVIVVAGSAPMIGFNAANVQAAIARADTTKAR